MKKIFVLLIVLAFGNKTFGVMTTISPCIITGETILVQQQSERDEIYKLANGLLKEGKFKEASDKIRSIKQMNWEDFYNWSVLLTLSRQYDDALSILEHFLENILYRITKTYVEIRWWDGMNYLYDHHPLYMHHIIDPGDDLSAQALIRGKNGLDATIRNLCKSKSLASADLKELELPKAPLPGDGMILKAFLLEFLDKPFEAKSCLESPDIMNDINIFSEYTPLEGEGNYKEEILKRLTDYHETDKVLKEYYTIINEAISEKRKLPERKKALEQIEIANQSFKRNDFEAALAEYHLAVQLDSLVLSQENVKEYLELCAVKIAEMKLNERRSRPERKKALAIIETANKSLSNKEILSAYLKYKQAVLIDSLVLSDENVKEYLKKCINELPELRLQLRSDANVILEKGKELLSQKNFEDAISCFDLIVKSGVYMQDEKKIELWNAIGNAYKSIGKMTDAENSFQIVKDLEQKLKDKSEQKGKSRGRS